MRYGLAVVWLCMPYGIVGMGGLRAARAGRNRRSSSVSSVPGAGTLTYYYCPPDTLAHRIHRAQYRG